MIEIIGTLSGVSEYKEYNFGSGTSVCIINSHKEETMSVKKRLAGISITAVAGLLLLSTTAFAQKSCSVSKSKAMSCQAASASCPKATSAPCCSKTASTGAAADIDTRVLKNIYQAARTGDFSGVAACPVSREALKTLSASNEHTRGMVLSAENRNDYSGVAACKVTRDEIRQSVRDYLLDQRDISSASLDRIHQAAVSGDFSEVAKCETTREVLKKVVLAKEDFYPECKDKVFEVVEGTADFSLVEACIKTRKEIQKAVEQMRANVLEASIYP
ncbi:MAG: hypothetical protein U9P14_01825 [Gemmatimonadota bacterium]|nr:hypothetical protein [Gemmatimonadota bacterium]